MKKRLLAVTLSICFILSMLMTVPVFASGSISINKTEFTAGEKVRVTVTSISEDDFWLYQVKQNPAI